MIYEQLLHEFVDGSLDYQQEAALFSELHANEELRSDLKMLILMGRSAAHDIDAFVPATESRGMILERLGFSSDAGTAVGAVGLGSLRGTMHGLLGGLVGALLTALILLGFDLSPWLVVRDSGVQVVSNAPASSPANMPAAGASSVADVSAAATAQSSGNGAGGIRPPSASSAAGSSVVPPVPPSASATAASLSSSTRNKPARSSAVASNSRNGNGREGNGIGAKESEERDGRIDDQTNAHALAMASTVELRGFDATPAQEYGGMETLLEHDGSPLLVTPSSLESQGLVIPPISMEYRALASRTFAARPEALANNSDALLRDAAVAARYRLNDRQSFGVEIGIEEFYQNFEQQLANGDFMRHEQNPVLFWGGVAYRHYLPLGSDLRPFLGLVAGATRIGPLGRLAVGASYEISPEIGIIAGGELSALGYSFQNRWYFTPKYALTYGISLNF